MSNNNYAVFAMRNGEPFHRETIIADSLIFADIWLKMLWDAGQEYYQELGYTLAVCMVNDYEEPVYRSSDGYEIYSKP